MAGSNLLYKFRHMRRDVLVRKLLSFEDVYATAIRPFQADAALPGDAPREFVPVAKSRRFWYADPALFTHDGGSWLFMEAFDRRAQLGRIACLRLNGTDDLPGTPRIVLAEPFHLSFPQVFSWKGAIWMLPETGGDHSLRLYRAAAFPDRWELAARFPTDAPLADTVVADGGESLTLLASELSAEKQYYYRYRRFLLRSGSDGALSLDEDDTFLRSQSFSHAARNAGGLFEERGALILPTQESTPTAYGVRMNFVRYRPGDPDILADSVGRVSPEDVRVRGFERAPRVFGTHSYARNAAYEAIDIQYMQFAPLKYPRKLARRLRGA